MWMIVQRREKSQLFFQLVDLGAVVLQRGLFICHSAGINQSADHILCGGN